MKNPGKNDVFRAHYYSAKMPGKATYLMFNQVIRMVSAAFESGKNKIEIDVFTKCEKCLKRHKVDLDKVEKERNRRLKNWENWR